MRITAFIAALAVVFAVSVWVGKAVGPNPSAAPESVGHSQAEHGADAAESPGGLQATQSGYTLDLARPIQAADKTASLQFRILDNGGAPVTRYVETHEKLLHLIVVRNDLTAFQHVHPVLDGGTWRVPVDLSRAGDYRVFADFVPAGGPPLTLGANLHVAGSYVPQPLPPAEAVSHVEDYTVTLAGTPKAGEPSTLTLSIARDGKPVDDLQPYLGAYGHLVALRAADLAYLHVHPMGEPGDGVTPAGPQVEFHTTFPSAGDYRLFLDFQHDGVVRTAAFTVHVAGTSGSPAAAHEHTEGGHGH
jgi:hypothetical protein